MKLRWIILLALIIVPCRAYTQTTANIDRQAVTVAVEIIPDTSQMTDPDALTTTRSMPGALAPLVRYALYRANWLMHSGDYHDAAARLTLTVRADYVGRPVMTRNDQRRYFSIVERYLHIKINYQWQQDGSSWSGRIEQTGATDWLRLDNPASRSVRFSPQRPEPSIFTMKRAVGKLYDKLFDRNNRANADPIRSLLSPTHRLPFQLTGDAPESDLLRLAGISMLDIFNTVLTEPTSRDSAGTISGKLEVRPPHPDYALGRKFEELGNAYPGADTIIVAQYPLVHPDLEFWRPYYSRLTLVHELAHTLGAIHVSDQTSLMNHGLQRLTDDRFDPLNRSIVTAALNGEFDPDDAHSYVAALSHHLEATGYRRADFPEIFSVYLSAANRNGDRKRMEAAINNRAFVLGGDAYSAIQQKDYSTAARLLREAVELAPDQAALWYYLAMSTRGEESLQALERAGQLGYYLASLMYRN